jgi:hypothetical protein
MFPPVGKKGAVFLKFGVDLALPPDIRTYGDILILVFIDNIQSFGGDHRMDPPHFIAYFPTNLE